MGVREGIAQPLVFDPQFPDAREGEREALAQRLAAGAGDDLPVGDPIPTPGPALYRADVLAEANLRQTA